MVNRIEYRMGLRLRNRLAAVRRGAYRPENNPDSPAGVPKRDGSGGGVRRNAGRGGCVPPRRRR